MKISIKTFIIVVIVVVNHFLLLRSWLLARRGFHVDISDWTREGNEYDYKL